ncbi:hypothetical protein ES708_23594 [subsurface metagenome]
MTVGSCAVARPVLVLFRPAIPRSGQRPELLGALVGGTLRKVALTLRQRWWAVGAQKVESRTSVCGTPPSLPRVCEGTYVSSTHA